MKTTMSGSMDSDVIAEDTGINFFSVSNQLNYLQGKILTIIEALNLAVGQEKAVKDLIKSSVSDTHDWLAKIAFKDLPMVSTNELKANGEDIDKIKAEVKSA